MKFIDLFLKAKHWQLFIAFFLPIIVPQILAINFFSEETLLFQSMNEDEIFSRFFELFTYIKYFILIIHY